MAPPVTPMHRCEGSAGSARGVAILASLASLAVFAVFIAAWVFELEDAAWNAGLGDPAWEFEPDQRWWDAAPRPPQAWLKLPPPAGAPIVGPDPKLLEPGAHGRLPRVGPDGRQAWRVYRRPFDSQDGRPRIAVVVTGLGLSRAATERAIERLPGAVTLTFAPYAKRLDRWLEQARDAGHEVLLDLPMEPRDYPRDDPGPYTLLTSLSAAQNLERLEWALSRGVGYVGASNLMGTRFASEPESLKPVFETLKRRGLLFLDSRTEGRVLAARLAADLELPYAVNDVQIDLEASRAAIDGALEDLERRARENGYALGMAVPYPVSVERIAQWAATLERKKIALAPVTALVNKQPLP
ncbi:MAG: divergent polysaccharide deacetylase family protein [Kiloniellales bacterium]